jgi:ABC-2 type transport system ATP-binding protein
LAFSYGLNPVLKNISTTLEEGKIYGLLGENGVGKTTLLTLLVGLKSPKSGKITADGHIPFRREPAFLCDQYYIPDTVAPVNMSASDFAASTGKFWPKFDLQKFHQILGEFEVTASQKMSAMSAGQLKKTYISFALATGAKNLYMDEPTNGLDIPSKAQFRSAITKYTREDGITVISTHQVRDLENIIDPIIILDRQDVLLNADVQEITSKLFFDYGRELHDDSLYSEQLPGGYIQVRPNQTGEESKLSVEALFNAVHSHKAVIKAMFSDKPENTQNHD